MRKARQPEDPDSFKAAYFRALRWLSARELSEAQVRDRLADRGYTDAAIGPAVDRLRQERTIDDRRVASAVARTEARVRRRGPRRILGKLISMQIDRDLAKEVVKELFGETDEQELLETTLERRKVLAYLVRQGFSASAAASALRQKSK